MGASNLKDMSVEELFSLVKPFLFLIPLAIVIVAVVIIITAVRKSSVRRMFSYMERGGKTAKDKQKYLTDYLLRVGKDGIMCPVCGKEYPIKENTTNSRGDRVERFNTDGCPHCKSQVRHVLCDHNIENLIVVRRKTDSSNEGKYQQNFERLSKLIEIYTPYIDTTPDPSDDTVTVTVTFK